MEVVNQLILLAGGLLLVSIVAGVLSSRVGAPLLLVFLGLGMLAGEDGVLGIPFADYRTAFLVGSTALAVILFDGGLRTPLQAIRAAWAPAGLLATVGVAITALVAGGVAIWALDLSTVEGLLVGAIIASTDAAAVFLLLHQRGLNLKKRLGATLEVESGANDPMAVFLTVTLAELAARGGLATLSWTIALHLAWEMTLGALVGIGGGLLLGLAVNRMELAPGLYPVFAVAGALVVFGGAESIDGSGFLAVYLAGIVAGNRKLRAQQLIRRFHDGIAWVSQIVMFFMLGLLVTPSALVPDLLPAGIIAMALMFVARPLAVFVCLAPLRFAREEMVFAAWVGLRGAVPIFLAVIPVLAGVAHATQIFNVAYIVVLASLLFQGWTVPWMARRLDVALPPEPETAGRLDIDLLPEFDRDLIGYFLRAGCPALKRPLPELHLPRRTRILAVLRDNAVVPMAEVHFLKPGDYVLALCPPEHVLMMDRLFVPPEPTRWRRPGAAALGDFAFDGATTAGAIADLYGLPIPPADRARPFAALIAERLPGKPAVGDRIGIGGVTIIIQAVERDTIIRVGLRLDPYPPSLLPYWLRRVGRTLLSLLGAPGIGR